MASVSDSRCVNCQAEATTRCAGCMNAPEYEVGDAASTVYCGRDCQTKHWKSHKAHCRIMQKRKRLFRTAKVLKAALLTYREVMYDMDLTKIELQDGVLCLFQSQRSINSRLKYGVFPKHLTTNNEHKEAALANNQCTTAMALLGRLTRKLLQGVPSTIELLDIHIGKPRVPTKLVPGPDASGVPHTVLRVHLLFSKETWIVDTAGCQYGFQEVLVPFDMYMKDKSCHIANDPTTYDATETKDLDFFATLPFMNKTKAQRDDRELERRIRLHFAKFVDSSVGKEVLEGSDIQFQGKLDNFASGLKSHMLAFKK